MNCISIQSHITVIKEGAGPGTTVLTITTDLLSFDSVRNAAAELNKIAQQNGGLDVLACNAGVMAMPDKRSSDGYDIQMQANQLSHYLLTKLCMESLESAAAARGEARVVYHSSSARNGLPSDLDPKFFQICDAGSLGGDDKMTAPWERYHQSKLANSAFAMALHDKLTEKGSKVKAFACDPGAAATNLQSSAENSGCLFSAMMSCAAPMGYVQSPADGCLSIGVCCFGPEANSGDLYMPSKKGGMTGPPKKSVSGGELVVKNESQTVSEVNKKLVLEECERVFGFASTL